MFPKSMGFLRPLSHRSAFKRVMQLLQNISIMFWCTSYWSGPQYNGRVLLRTVMTRQWQSVEPHRSGIRVQVPGKAVRSPHLTTRVLHCTQRHYLRPRYWRVGVELSGTCATCREEMHWPCCCSWELGEICWASIAMKHVSPFFDFESIYC